MAAMHKGHHPLKPVTVAILVTKLMQIVKITFFAVLLLILVSFLCFLCVSQEKMLQRQELFI